MPKIRVLVVDDSVVIRRLLSDILASDPLLEVAGTAANGRIGLARIPQVNPDLVTLDVEMPEMNGLEALAAIRQTYPHLPVIMFSTMTHRGAEATLDALALGASDYVTKPANVGSVATGIQRIRDDLIPKIKRLCPAVLGSSCPLARPPSPHQARRAARMNRSTAPAETGPATRRVDILAMGVSTGGPHALATLWPALPENFPVPIVIVQHMPPLFTRLLAERLSSLGTIRVRESKAGAALEPGQAWLAAGDYHMELERGINEIRLRVHQGPPENSCRPAVDVLFRTVARLYGVHALAVVLTGMGQDGLRGCEGIREAGGQILVQDEASSIVWGMPGFVAQAGLADKIVPLDQLAFEITRRVQAGRCPTEIPPVKNVPGLGLLAKGYVPRRF